MYIHLLKSKISYAKITDKNLRYVGSITIDADIMDKAKLRENELVHVVNLNNGERLETYVIAGKRGSGVFALNGPAARKAEIDDEIFILSYAMIDPDKEAIPEPALVDLLH